MGKHRLESFTSAFFAYPARPSEFTQTIDAAVELATKAESKLDLEPWPQMEIFGESIDDKIREEISSRHVTYCDVTFPNTNVYYEIGFAIGSGKPIGPVVNSAFSGTIEALQKDGLFDVIGFSQYENAEELANVLCSPPTKILLDLYEKPLHQEQPLYFFDTFRKTDFRNALASAIKEAKVFFRSFDPYNTPIFSTHSAVADVTSSAGVIIPLLASNIDDADRHNLRAAFLAGLSHGRARETLLIEFNSGPDRQPADFRRFVESIRNPGEARDKVLEFAPRVLLATQSVRTKRPRQSRSRLQKLSIGASAAENEFRSLERYFVETAEYLRVLRGEASIVSGRKGSGKTAIFFRARDHFRESKHTLVVDLKPESHQLSVFREELMKIVGVGAFDHSLTAFWNFLVLSEVVLKIRRDLEMLFSVDATAFAEHSEIDETLSRYDIRDSGDFTFRINSLTSLIVQEIKRQRDNDATITLDLLTNVIYRDALPELRELIEKQNKRYQSIVFLFDNIDKGWSPKGVDQFDVRIVRLLVEALNKIKRDFSSADLRFAPITFLRNDIYELLIDATPDRGKAGQVLIDWADRSKLKLLILHRMRQADGGTNSSFDEVWSRYFVPKVGERDSFEFFVDHCLMRPRFLINIIENAVATAINREHSVVEESDCIAGVSEHANYLVSDFGYEIRDVSGLPSTILYAFRGVSDILTKDEAKECLVLHGIEEEALDEAFDLLLWYGILGVGDTSETVKFIYDFGYDSEMLRADLKRYGDDILFVVNPAVSVSLAA